MIWQTLFKAFTDAAGPLLKPVLTQLVQKVIQILLTNLNNGTVNPVTPPTTGGLALTADDHGKLVEAVVAELMK